MFQGYQKLQQVFKCCLSAFIQNRFVTRLLPCRMSTVRYVKSAQKSAVLCASIRYCCSGNRSYS